MEKIMRNRVETPVNIRILASIDRSGAVNVKEPSSFPIKGEINFKDTVINTKDNNSFKYNKGAGVNGRIHWNEVVKETAKFSCPRHAMKSQCHCAETRNNLLNY
jgi:hypothetical protein